ncbi:EAL domain-containing protein [uncultured Cohaesibacter sp.]|uniref:putative bifunctional diguanylate cyclase/phosphodiesterase n=1 Tax=uncultured Cohaesibacter sp. TaxID=1002546 RepID=UPI0029C98F79|nr:EAL domain-containing protein [uncultured Cohaesibacter sp.]
MSQSQPSEVILNLGPSDLMELAVPLWIFDVDKAQVVWANEAARYLWQAETLNELYQRNMRADMSSSIEGRLSQYKEVLEDADKTFRELWTLYPNGQPATYQISIRRYRLEDQRIGLLCQASAEQDHVPEQMRSAEALNHIPISITLFTREGSLLYANTEANRVYGWGQSPLSDLFTNDDVFADALADAGVHGHATHCCQLPTLDGFRWREISIRACRDSVSGVPAFILSDIDITDQKTQQQKITYLAHHDILTGLHSRNYVNHYFPKLLSKAKISGDRLAMLLIDLDNFKTINDTLGHLSGDGLLIHVARQIKTVMRGRGHIARLGGDEFTILMPFEDTAELDLFCKEILRTISSEVKLNDHVLSTYASIGISLFPEHGTELPSLMQHADLALYEAKDEGRKTFRYYRPALQQAALLKRTLEKDLTRAIKEREFRLYYQPRVDCISQKVLSVEALMRWYHPNQGVISPAVFIETLEETGMIHQVGDWIISQAGYDQKVLTDNGYDIPISINVSAEQFAHANFVTRLKDNLRKTGCDSSRIEIEITESMLMGHGYDAKAVLLELRKAGFSIAVDDFGTGYSNLAYIQSYPISSLKVDRSFIQMIEDQSSVVNMILSLCRLIGVTAVAEGVETIDQLAWLQLNHCNEYQGYLYSKPRPLHQLLHLLNNPPNWATGGMLVGSDEQDLAWA